MEGAELLDACREAADEPAALAAVDLALWDRAGRRAGRPVASLMCESPLGEVRVNATLARRTARARGAGGAGGGGGIHVREAEGGHRATTRAGSRRCARRRGRDTALRVDANGAWSLEEAVRWIDVLAPAGLELVEEPVHGVAAMRSVRERVAVRVAIDETAEEAGALGSGAADAVCLKISRCGGISGLLAAAALVRTSGSEPYLASTSTAHSASRRLCMRPRRSPRAGRCPTAAWRRSCCSRGCGPAAGARARSRCPRRRARGRAAERTRRGDEGGQRAGAPRRRGARCGRRRWSTAATSAGRRARARGRPRLGQLDTRYQERPSGVRCRRTSDRGCRRSGRRASQLSEPLPQRGHLAGADAAQHGCEGARVVAALVVARELAHLGRLAGEKRLRAPALDAGLERAPASSSSREAMVGLAPPCSLARILDARRGAISTSRSRARARPARRAARGARPASSRTARTLAGERASTCSTQPAKVIAPTLRAAASPCPGRSSASGR